MKFIDLSKKYCLLSDESSFVKKLIKYYLSSKDNDILKEEFDIFLQRLVMTSEELDQELYRNHGVTLGNQDIYRFSINRDISYMIQDKSIAFSRAHSKMEDTISTIKKVAAEIVKDLEGLNIDDFLQSLKVNALRNGLVNKILDKVTARCEHFIKSNYIEKSLPYLYDDVLFSESVAELYLFDDYQKIKEFFLSL